MRLSLTSAFDYHRWKGRVGKMVGYFPANYVYGLDRIEVEEEEENTTSRGQADSQDFEYFESYSRLVSHYSIHSLAPFSLCSMSNLQIT